MATSTTRSIYGATYAPVDWNDEGDPGSELLPREKVQGFEPANAYKKAKLFSYLLKDPGKSTIISNAFRNKYLSDESDLLDEQAKAEHTRLLNIVDGYSGKQDYHELVTSLRHVGTESLTSFVEHWLTVEHDLIIKGIDDWKATAEDELKQKDALEDEQSRFQQIKLIKSDIEKHFLTLSKEIALLRSRLTHRAPSNSEKTPNSETGRTIDVPLTSEKENISTPSLGIPKRKIWTEMWENEARRDSVTFLSSYFSPRIKMSYKGLMDVNRKEYLTVFVTEFKFVQAFFAYTNIVYRMLEDLGLESVGRLYLERLDFTPIGYVKGELVYSLPLVPGEKITVSHREWSKTTEEYVKEVEIAMEEEREKELSETTELTESSDSEKKVEHRAEVGIEASFGGGSWNIATNAGYSYLNSSNKAVQHSSKRNQNISSKAASRSKKEHKMQFRVARQQYTEDEQVREIQNSGDEAVRWDFHRLMQKWKIDLFHLEERLTYEIVVPEPADYLLRKHIELKNVLQEIEEGDPFKETVDSTRGDRLDELCEKYGVDIEFPEDPLIQIVEDEVDYTEGEKNGYRTVEIEFPEGYRIVECDVIWPVTTEEGIEGDIIERRYSYTGHNIFYDSLNTLNKQRLEFVAFGITNKFSWLWQYHYYGEPHHDKAHITIHVRATPTAMTLSDWRRETFNKIRDAARARWIVTLEGLQVQRDRLIQELTGKDALKLRQIEREEIMKAVLRWGLGPEFEFYPGSMTETLAGLYDSEELDWEDLGYYDDSGRVRAEVRETMLQHGTMVRFLQQAVEWENVNWIMYPYFWTRPDRWDFKQNLDHPDFYHRSFLRGGCARVVLTIRPEYEELWLALVEGEEELPEDHVYIRLAEEIKNNNTSTYAYTPDPNRDELVERGELKDTWYEYTPTGALDIELGTTLEDR